MSAGAKICNVCGTEKVLAEFPTSAFAGYADGREKRCRQCKKEGRTNQRKPGEEPKPTPKGNGRAAAPAIPEFLSMEQTTSYVIAGAEDVRIALSAEQLDELVAWWKSARAGAVEKGRAK